MYSHLQCVGLINQTVIKIYAFFTSLQCQILPTSNGLTDRLFVDPIRSSFL